MQRWLKLASHLPEFGIEPVIFTPENPAFHLQDKSLLEEVPAGIQVWKRPIWEPLRLLGNRGLPIQGQVLEKKKKTPADKLLVYLRASFFIPDPRVFWVRPAVKFLLPKLRKNNIDTVITTGPPHSMHLIGLALKERMDIRWVADFRDPWSKWDILDKLGVSGRARSKHEALERKVIENADLLITVSPSWEADFRSLGAAKSFVLTNGFDKKTEKTGAAATGRFRLSHIGMLNEMRNPLVLWQTLAELCGEDRQFSTDLEIYLAGIPSEKVTASIRSFPELSGKLVVDGYLSHEGALRAMSNSALLLLLTNESSNAKGHIPGKLFEYLSVERPVLAMGDPEGDSAKILLQTNAGRCVSYGDAASLRREIMARYADFKAGKKLKTQGTSQYSRRSLALKLAMRLNEL